jgi:hypothetical protein
MDIKELKARAYDLLAMSEQISIELKQINEQIVKQMQDEKANSQEQKPE